MFSVNMIVFNETIILGFGTHIIYPDFFTTPHSHFGVDGTLYINNV